MRRYLKERLDRAAPTAQSLWFLPSIVTVGMVLLAVLVANIDAEPPGFLDPLIYKGEPAAARDIVSVGATSVASVVTLTLTLTVVALQLVSSQFSPRILREFLSDRTSKSVVSLLVGTFAFALVTLFFIESPAAGGSGGSQGSEGFVPGYSISLLLGLAMVGLIGLVVFIHNLTQSLRIENILDGITDGALETIERRLDERKERGEEQRGLALDVDPSARPLTARRHGYVIDIDIDGLVGALEGSRVALRTVPVRGEYVALGAITAWVWHDDGSEVTDEQLDELRDVLDSNTTIGPNRSVESDATFGVRQLVDIANRAMSPGINDPTTAVAALGRVTTLVDRLIDTDLFESIQIDGDDCRIHVDQPTASQLIESSVLQPIIYASGDLVVVRHLCRQLGSLGRQVDGDLEELCIRLLDVLLSTAESKLPDAFHDELSDLRDDTLARIRDEPRAPAYRVV